MAPLASLAHAPHPLESGRRHRVATSAGAHDDAAGIEQQDALDRAARDIDVCAAAGAQSATALLTDAGVASFRSTGCGQQGGVAAARAAAAAGYCV